MAEHECVKHHGWIFFYERFWTDYLPPARSLLRPTIMPEDLL